MVVMGKVVNITVLHLEHLGVSGWPAREEWIGYTISSPTPHPLHVLFLALLPSLTVILCTQYPDLEGGVFRVRGQ
jgi:hypothetical protein